VPDKVRCNLRRRKGASNTQVLEVRLQHRLLGYRETAYMAISSAASQLPGFKRVSKQLDATSVEIVLECTPEEGEAARASILALPDLIAA